MTFNGNTIGAFVGTGYHRKPEFPLMIPVRTINGNTHMIEVDDQTSVYNVKQKLSEITNHPADGWQLLFKGKNLDDSELVRTIKIDSGFLIATKRRPPKPIPQKVEPKEVAPPPQPESAPKPLKPLTTVAAPAEQPSVLPLPDFPSISEPLKRHDTTDFDESVAYLTTQLGYNKNDAEDALRFSGCIREHAIEILLSGRLDEIRAMYTRKLKEQELLERIRSDPALLQEFQQLQEAQLLEEAEEDDIEIPEEEFTPEQEESILRLMEISGCSRERVEEIFIACEKNETMAANILLDDNIDK